jgi:hypothetical protein
MVTETCTCPWGEHWPALCCKHVLLVGIINAKRQMQRRRNFIATLQADAQEG